MATRARRQLSLATLACGSRSLLLDSADSQPAGDMHLYCQFPTSEDHSLQCKVCTQVVRPQGFLTHYERRHGSPSSSRAPLVPMKAKMSLSQSEVEPLPFRVPRDFPHSRFNKAPLAVYPPKGGRTKPCVSLPVVSLEKMPCFTRSEGTHVKVNSTTSTLSIPSSTSSVSSSTSTSLKSALASPASHKNQEKLLNGRGPVTPRSTTPPQLGDRRPSPSRSPLDKHTTPSPSSQDKKPTSSSPSPSSLDRRTGVPPAPSDKRQPNGAKGSRHKRVSGRVFDPNKHCGVLDPESKRPCTRSLTCKTHSLTHRRAVPGRKKDFDVLLAEHKGRAKEKEVGQKKETVSSQSAQSAQSLDTLSSLPTSCHNSKTTPTLKLRLANAHTHRGSGGGGAVVLSSTPVPLPAPDPVVPSWQKYGGDAHISSDEGDAELPEETEKPSYHYTPCHPHPMSWCAFSSRLMGRGHYVFDRRWDRMRLALHCMVEKHVNAQMWRKVPLVADSVVSTSPNPSAMSPLSYPPPPNPTPALPHGLDGVSMVSYSTPFSHNGAGVFCIRDPDPSPKLQQTKAAKPARTTKDGGTVKKRKPPPTSEVTACRKNGNGYHPPPGPTHISNGTAALSVRAKPRTGGQGPRDSDKYASVELSLPHALTGDHGGVSSHSPLPCSSTDSRKRKTSSPGDKPSKITKTTSLDGIFRKTSTSLMSSASEASQNTLSRLPKVHH